jgi:nucleotidyltransferase substrate binding protein (TIGR01987 family)
VDKPMPETIPDPDVRWRQRFSNYMRAFQTLDRAVELAGQRDLSELEEQGLIQSFEFTHELAWNLLKDYLTEKGVAGLIGSKDASRKAFQNGLVENGDVWMGMIRDRNLTSHTYDPAVARDVVNDVLERFYPAFKALAEKFTALCEQDED